MDRMSVLFVDDWGVFTDAMIARLGAEPDLQSIKMVSSCEAAGVAIKLLAPDVVLVDTDLRDEDGMGAVARLSAEHPDLKIVVLSSTEDPSLALDAVLAGVCGWVSKTASIEELLQAIRGAARGETWMPPRLLTEVFLLFRHQQREHDECQRQLAELSEREREVLGCMVAGLDRRGIAERLFLSTHTVRTHTQHILSKLKVHSALEAVALAVRAGFAHAEGVNRAEQIFHSMT